jgi:hypothetical protein
MKDARLLAVAILHHIRETLQAAHSHTTHREMLEAIGHVATALEQKDEDEALRDLIALSEAIDVSIPDEELAAVTFEPDAGAELEPDDDDDDDDAPKTQT